MKFVRLPVTFLLVACIPLAASSCYSGLQYAEESAGQIVPGMSMSEVRAKLGDPDLIVRGDPGSETSWFYRYEGGASPVCYVLAVIFIVAIIVLLVAASGGGGGGGWGGGGGGGGGDGPPYQIQILFDGEGRVTEVSAPHPVSGR